MSTPELISPTERAALADLVAALPPDLDTAPIPVLRELREQWGIEVGHIWPSVRRLDLAVRVIEDRRRRARPPTSIGRDRSDPREVDRPGDDAGSMSRNSAADR